MNTTTKIVIILVIVFVLAIVGWSVYYSHKASVEQANLAKAQQTEQAQLESDIKAIDNNIRNLDTDSADINQIINFPQ